MKRRNFLSTLLTVPSALKARWQESSKICGMKVSDDYWIELFAEHKIQVCAASWWRGVDWSCSCRMQGHSADRRDHWADVMMKGIEHIELRRSQKQFLRELIFSDIDEAIARAVSGTMVL